MCLAREGGLEEEGPTGRPGGLMIRAPRQVQAPTTATGGRGELPHCGPSTVSDGSPGPPPRMDLAQGSGDPRQWRELGTPPLH